MTLYMLSIHCGAIAAEPTTDDEPDDGPDYYFIISGFASVEFFSDLAPLGISPNALCKVCTYTYMCSVLS